MLLRCIVMKKVVRIVLCCVIGVYLAIGTTKLVSDAFSLPATNMEVVSRAAREIETMTSEQSGYKVKTVGGKIAVEDLKTGEIINSTDTRVDILPQKDRNQLKQGIVVKTKSELRSVLEDLCS